MDYDGSSNSSGQPPFSMSGDGTPDDVTIPSVFMHREDSRRLVALLAGEEEVFILLTWIHKEGEEAGEEGEKEGEGRGEGGGEGEGGEEGGKREGEAGPSDLHSNSLPPEHSGGSLYNDGYEELNRDNVEPEWDTDTHDTSHPDPPTTDKSNH